MTQGISLRVARRSVAELWADCASRKIASMLYKRIAPKGMMGILLRFFAR